VLQRRREQLAQLYLDGLKEVFGITPASLPVAPPSRHSWCMFPILVDSSTIGITRDEMIEELSRRKIGTSVHYIPTHLFSAYQNAARTDLSVTELIWTKLLSLPLYPGMADADVARVLASLTEIVSERRPRAMQAAT
jgi:dTDP-4-amino-4,6-dideoxygalactose transaminase